jgi:integrase
MATPSAAGPPAHRPGAGAEDGEELAVVSRSLAHSQLSTTTDVYAHLTPAMLERETSRMDRILGARTG